MQSLLRHPVLASSQNLSFSEIILFPFLFLLDFDLFPLLEHKLHRTGANSQPQEPKWLSNKYL